MKLSKSIALPVLILPFALSGGLALGEDSFSRSTISLFTGISNKSDLLEIVQFKLESFEPYSILGLGYNKVLLEPTAYYDLEGAGQIVKHLEKAPLLELNGFLVFRWKWFPWNSVIGTSLGIGDGISYTTGYPSSETLSQNIYSMYLNYIWVNVRFDLPSLPNWKFDFIIHHRSGIYGLINGIRGGSNYLCLGISRDLL